MTKKDNHDNKDNDHDKNNNIFLIHMQMINKWCRWWALVLLQLPSLRIILVVRLRECSKTQQFKESIGNIWIGRVILIGIWMPFDITKLYLIVNGNNNLLLWKSNKLISSLPFSSRHSGEQIITPRRFKRYNLNFILINNPILFVFYPSFAKQTSSHFPILIKLNLILKDGYIMFRI